jgi:hypothetical protein
VPTPSSEWKEDDNDLPELSSKKVTAARPDGADLDDKNLVQTADKAVAASPLMMKLKASVAKASVVTAAPTQHAAIPKLCAAATMPSNGLKPSATTSCKLAADTTALKVSVCMCIYAYTIMCTRQNTSSKHGGCLNVRLCGVCGVCACGPGMYI